MLQHGLLDYGVIDCHAHILPPAAGASGFADAATHRLHQQRAMHVHGNQPYRRTRDNAIVTERVLWNADDPSPAGARDVCFRVGRFGRFEWTHGTEDYHVQFLPPWMEDLSMSAEKLVAMMDYAGITSVVLQNDHIYGNLGEYFADAIARYPGRFVGTAQVEEGRAYQESELERLDEQISRLGMDAVYFTTTGLFQSGYRPLHSDRVYDPFWQEVERHGKPVCWVQSTHSPVGTYEDELNHLVSIMERFPDIHHVLVHGVPTSIYADDSDRLTLPDILHTVLKSGKVSSEILYPISWGRRHDYPYARAHVHIRQLIDLFGVKPFLWGSDSPNVERYCTYAQSLSYFSRHCDYLSEAERQMILRDNALGVFRTLDRSGASIV